MCKTIKTENTILSTINNINIMKTIKSFAILLTMGLGLVSCVENIESESVKAIRDAKATELLALADLHKAQAEAESLLAKAEAALLEAQARYENALAEGEELENQVAKANLELEIAAIKANLESELQYLMDQIASYKNSVNEELFDQLDYWFTELGNQSQNLFTYQTYLYDEYSYDDAYETSLEEKIYYKELLQEFQSRNTYNEAIIAEYEKYIAANEIDVEALLPEVAALRGQIETLEEELYWIEEDLDDIDYNIYDGDPSDDNTSLYEHMENINDILFNVFDILDTDGDDYLDEDEGIFHLEPTADYYSYYIDINHEALARLDAYMDMDYYSMILEFMNEVLGTEADKWNAEIPYDENTLYAINSYWAERVETFKTKFQKQINDVHTALMDAMDELADANSMDAGEAKDAAVKAAEAKVAAALDALDVYTMAGADKTKWGTFTKFIAETYDMSTLNSTPALFDITDPSIIKANSITLNSVSRTYYTVEGAFYQYMLLELPATHGASLDDIEDLKSSIEYLINTLDEHQTLRGLIDETIAEGNALIKKYEEKLAVYMALESELMVLEGQLAAKMDGIQMEKVFTVEYLKEEILFYQTEIDVNNKMIEVLQGKGGKEAYMEYLVKVIESTRDRIATINGIIDALEAKIVENNAGGTTEE